MSGKKVCFVVMPFRPELNFFFLYLQRYLEETHGLSVRRGDTSVLTKALMEKIEFEIQNADFIIGDISHPNPNVFYELGIARANGKPVIFLTQDEPEKAPVDVREFEFIRYDLSRHDDLLTKLDNAVQHLLGPGYQELYDRAITTLQIFNSETESTFAPASIEEFQARAIRAERLEGLPDTDDDAAVREFVLPKIISDATNIAIMRKIDLWLTPPPID
ncbi:hypothetical protein [Acaryochloris marina]|uniref:hypothetical protein n=1 Tax=Acaryochloris marina TaxID=155978 RepID=UPI001BAE6478|nr:hypothetical protein [Acaryochloris marina]QUY43289.1 hypothetical protein I1H34_03810 [Acaryochloris marina S15]